MKIESLLNECTGCGACVSLCPMQCISFKVDGEGFYTPVINSEKCIKCGKCETVCHCLSHVDISIDKHSYYGRSTDEEVLKNSTSGGAFAALAKGVISNGGNVYGAAFDYGDLTLKHTSTDFVALEELQKSKYIESFMGSTIADIKRDLAEGRRVLFCGTPCQAAGVRHAIGENDLLLICDFICHGVPSSGVFKEYLGERLRKNERVVGLDFRPKEYGWKGKYLKTVTDRRTTVIPYHLDAFYKGFMTDNAFLRRSCYNCQYREKHYSDITIADFWGYREVDPKPNAKKGLSLLVANNDKGNAALTALCDFELCEIDNKYSDYAFAQKDYSAQLALRERFYGLKEKHGFKKAALKTYMKKYYRQRIKYFVKKMLGRV